MRDPCSLAWSKASTARRPFTAFVDSHRRILISLNPLRSTHSALLSAWSLKRDFSRLRVV
jgi:hypothetical protein